MLPVLKAVAFVTFDLGGGSSQPCIVSVTDENGNFIKDFYVIKIFQDHRRKHSCNEVYASYLAKCFDLNMPQPALVEVNGLLMRQLKKEEKYKDWIITEGVFFATKYMEGVKSFTDTISLKRYDYREINNVFAFDVLIMNLDRQRENPNVFIKTNVIYVIDHESSMNISKLFCTYLNQNPWDYTINQNRGGHLFVPYLRQLNKKEKVTFNEFTDNLRLLKPDLLYNFAQQLAEYDYEPFNIHDIVLYLADVKNNESKFLELLDKLLR